MLGDWPKARIHPRVLQCRWDDFTARIYAGMAGSVLVIVRQVNASPDMRRAARISMYCGITHLRQIISSLNYIFPRRTPVTARGFISHLHRPSMRTKTEFLGHFPRRRCIAYAPRLLDRAFRFMQIAVAVRHRFLHVSGEKSDCQGCVRVCFSFAAHSSSKITKCWTCEKPIVKLILPIIFIYI